MPIHRFYYLKSGDHLLTVDADEGLQAGYTYEGVAFDVFTAPATNRHPIYRCYVSTVGDHFVSEDPDCESTTVEGLFGFVASAPTDAVARPIVRCHHPSIADHLTTTDEAECRIHGYLVEAVLGYVK